MSKKTALITGVTGQDGAYLVHHLLNLGYEVHGIKRRVSVDNQQRINPMLFSSNNFHIHTADLCDSPSLHKVIDQVKPDEVYNLAAQSHVGESFRTPVHTAEVNAMGPLHLLEAIRQVGATSQTKFYQASTSELYGKVQEVPQTEKTPFYPRSPYAVAKLYAYWITVNYRESYNLYSCNGILFNHESPIRGEEFVTRKITLGVAKILHGQQEVLELGNMSSKRDWGHAKDYTRGMHLILQQDTPQDYVLASGQEMSVRKFVQLAFQAAHIELEFEGTDMSEVGRDKKTGRILVKVNPKYYRPAEVDRLMGNPSLAEKNLGWKASITAEQLCEEMVNADIYRIERELNKNKGLPTLEDKLFSPSHKNGAAISIAV